ncbi:hypothetical protein WMR86_11455 [Proteus vulgaris]
MSYLFHEIENDILIGNTKITDILRKVLKLSYELNDENLNIWVRYELGGYPENQPGILPYYRYVKTMLRGNFIFNGVLSLNEPIQSHLLPQNEREIYASGRVYLPISEIDFISLGGLDKHPQRELPANLLSYFSNYPMSLSCLKAFEVIPLNNFVKIVDELKTNILLFLMEIKKKFPEIENKGKIPIMNKQEKDSMNQILTMNVYGNANIANASENFNQNIQLQSDELIKDLISKLIKLKEQDQNIDVIDAVISQIEEMKQIKDQKGIMDKLASVMTIAGGSASVCSLVAQYIPAISKLVG